MPSVGLAKEGDECAAVSLASRYGWRAKPVKMIFVPGNPGTRFFDNCIQVVGIKLQLEC